MNGPNMTVKVQQLTPLLRCHWPVDAADSKHLALLLDRNLRCTGFPTVALWFSTTAAAAAFVAMATAAAVSVLLHLTVLCLLHAGHVRIKDLGVVGICANAVSDLILTLNLAANQLLIPLLQSSQSLNSASVTAVIAAVWPAILCRFRVYISQCCLCMDILVTASVACFAGKRLRERLLDSAPCGIFMLPGLMAFVTLGLHVWFLVLSECRQLSFQHAATGVWTCAPILLTEYSWVGCVLFGLALSTQLPPSIITGICLWRRRHSDVDVDDPSTDRQLTLAAWLLLAHLLSLPSSLLLSGFFTQSPRLQRGGMSLLAMSLVSDLTLAVMLVVKPVLYLLLHHELRTAFKVSILRRRLSLPADAEGRRQPLLQVGRSQAAAAADELEEQRHQIAS